MNRIVCIVAIALWFLNINAQIFIDENFSDWKSSYLKADSPGNNVTGNIDFQKLWITDDDDYLYIRIDLDQEIKLQETNKPGILIDIDNNINKGFKANGIGAKLSYYLIFDSGLITLNQPNQRQSDISTANNVVHLNII